MAFAYRYKLERQQNAWWLVRFPGMRRLLDLRHSSHMWIIDEALAKTNAELSIDLPKPRARRRAA